MQLNGSQVTMQGDEPNSRPSSPGVNQLMVACQQGNDTEVRRILAKKSELVNQKDRTGKCALHYCAENKSTACAAALLELNGELVRCQDEEGYSTLHLAVISGNKKMAKFLLLKGADPNCQDNEHHSCVHWATVCGEIDCLEMLLNGGADPSTPDIHGAFPIHYAAQMCGPNSEMGNDVRVGLFVLRKLLESGVDVNCRDQDGRQPLLWAASTGSGDAILALVNAGASVCSVDKDGLTALHCASSRGHVECLDTLITLCGAEVDFMDNNGCTALFYSVTLGHADCTNLLLKYGANPNRQDRKGRTPAHCGAAKGQLETIKILSQYGANIWMRNIRGDLPLHEAVQSGRRDLVRWLLEQLPVAVNAGNSNGRTALHIAAVNNNIEMCKILMDLSANVNPLMRNSKSQLMSPLDAALQRGNQGCAKYLQLHGALPATKLLEKHGVNRAFLASIETRNRIPIPEMKIRSPYDNTEMNLQTSYPQNTRIESSAQTDIHRFSGTDRESQANHTDFDQTKIVSVDVHQNCNDSDEKNQPSNLSRNSGTTDKAEWSRDQSTSPNLETFTDNEKESTAIFTLNDTAQQTSTMELKKEVDRLVYTNGSNKSRKNGGRNHRVEFESVKGDGDETDGDMPNDSLTEEGSYYPYRGRRAKSENTLRKKSNREAKQSLVGRFNKQRSYSEPRSKVNYVRVVNGDLEPYYLKDDRVLTIEINENQMPSLVPNITSRQRSHNQNQITKLIKNSSATDQVSVISPNSSVRSTESNTTTLKDSGFSDYIETIRSAREVSSEGSTEALASNNLDRAERFWTSDSAADMVDFSRRRRIKRRPLKSDNPNREMEKNSDIVSEFKNAGPRVAERLQKERIGSVNLNNVKSKIDTGFYGRRSTTIPTRERARVIKVIRPASETKKYTNPETIAQEVQQSLRKFELERKLFQELQDLKRQQIRSGRANEAFMVKRLVDKFRKDVLGPGIKDFEPPYSYRNFERYLYDVLRQLSTSNHGKVPKLKPVEEMGLKSTFISEPEGTTPSQCVIRTYKCTHASEAYGGYPASVEQVFHNKNYTKLPAIHNNYKILDNKTYARELLSDTDKNTKTLPTNFQTSNLHEKRTIASLQKITKNERKREILPKKRPAQLFKSIPKGANNNPNKIPTDSQTIKDNGWISKTKNSPEFYKPSKRSISIKANTAKVQSKDLDTKESKVKITRDRKDSIDEDAKKLIEKEATQTLEDIVSKVVNDVGSGRPVSQIASTDNNQPKHSSHEENSNDIKQKHPVLSSITSMFTSPIRFIKGYETKKHNELNTDKPVEDPIVEPENDTLPNNIVEKEIKDSPQSSKPNSNVTGGFERLSPKRQGNIKPSLVIDSKSKSNPDNNNVGTVSSNQNQPEVVEVFESSSPKHQGSDDKSMVNGKNNPDNIENNDEVNSLKKSEDDEANSLKKSKDIQKVPEVEDEIKERFSPKREGSVVESVIEGKSDTVQKLLKKSASSKQKASGNEESSSPNRRGSVQPSSVDGKSNNDATNSSNESKAIPVSSKRNSSAKKVLTKENSSPKRLDSAVPSVVLEAVRENLDRNAKPDDLVTVEVSTGGSGDESTKLTQTLTVQELIEATQSNILTTEKEWEYPGKKGCPRVKSADEPFTFEIKHGKEKNIYKLPSDKLTGSKKYQITFVIGRQPTAIKS